MFFQSFSVSHPCFFLTRILRGRKNLKIFRLFSTVSFYVCLGFFLLFFFIFWNTILDHKAMPNNELRSGALLTRHRKPIRVSFFFSMSFRLNSLNIVYFGYRERNKVKLYCFSVCYNNARWKKKWDIIVRSGGWIRERGGASLKIIII